MLPLSLVPWLVFIVRCTALASAALLVDYGLLANDESVQIPVGNLQVNITFSRSLTFLRRRVEGLRLNVYGWTAEPTYAHSHSTKGYLDSRGLPVSPSNGESLHIHTWASWPNYTSSYCANTTGNGSTFNTSIYSGTIVFYRQISADNAAHGEAFKHIRERIGHFDPAFQSFLPNWAFIFTQSEVGKSCGADGMCDKTDRALQNIQLILTTDGRYSFAIFTKDGSNITLKSGDEFLDWYSWRNPPCHPVLPVIPIDNNTVQVFQVHGSSITGDPCSSTHATQLTITPRSGSILGGTRITISGICLRQFSGQESLSVMCKFGDRIVKGARQGSSALECISPALSLRGMDSYNLKVSLDGGVTFPYETYYNSYYDWYASSVTFVNRNDWVQRSQTIIQLKWNSDEIDPDSLLDRSRTNISVDFVGWYASDNSLSPKLGILFLPLVRSAANTGRINIIPSGISFGSSNKMLIGGLFRIMRASDRSQLNNGSINSFVSLWSPFTDMVMFEKLKTTSNFTDQPDTIQVVDNVTVYSIRNTILATYDEVAANYIGLDHGSLSISFDFPFPVTVDQRDRQRLLSEVLRCLAGGNFCECWARAERNISLFDSDDCNEFPSCPPNVLQAWLNRGRFFVAQDGSACNRLNRSDVFFRPLGDCPQNSGALLCLMANTQSWRYEQQCCYGEDGNLIAPTSAAGGRIRMKGLLGWYQPNATSAYYWIARNIEDTIVNALPMKKCCNSFNLNNSSHNDCTVYRQQRKGGTDRCYVPPRPGAGFGDPHIMTYDGLQYTFNGLGEFVLLEIPNTIVVQGRTSRAKSEQGVELSATVWTGLSYKAGNITVQIILSNGRSELELRIQQKVIDLTATTDQLTEGDVVIKLSRRDGFGVSKISTSFPSGILVEAEETEATLRFQIILPGEFQKNNSNGLLGRWNGDPTDDLYPRGRTEPIPSNSSMEDIFSSFGETWRVLENETLFQYVPPESYNTINDKTFKPIFDMSALLNDTFKREVLAVCGSNKECLFDAAATGSLRMGRATLTFAKEVEKEFKLSVTSCQRPAIDESVIITSNASFTSGSSIVLQCRNDNYTALSGIPKLVCTEDGTWEGEPLKCQKTENNGGTAANCPRPAIDESVVITANASFSSESSILLQCRNDSYTAMSGSAKLVCTENGSWTGEPLKCRKKQTNGGMGSRKGAKVATFIASAALLAVAARC